MTRASPRRILVTGGAGVIGRHAVEGLLREGADVHVVGRRAASAALPPGAAGHDLDLLDPIATAALVRSLRPTDLLHLAWETRHGLFWQAPENLDWLAATLALVRAFAAAGGRRFIGAGTCAEYDWTHPALRVGNCLEVDTPVAPKHLYGIVKDTGRRTLESFSAIAGFEMAWGRVFLLFGPGEDRRRLVPSIIDNLAGGRRAPCSGGAQQRDFLASCEVGAAFAALALSPVTGAVNIGSGVDCTIGDVAMKIGRLMGREELIGLGDLPTRADDPPRLVADVGRLRDEVGFIPDVSLDARLAEYVAAERRLAH